jgi:AcrR family transcriptional regulator
LPRSDAAARAKVPTGKPARSTRDIILDTAERHFAERGFDGVSVREIAADAGLKNQASLYHHFRNKRDLYEAVLNRGIEPIIAVVAASSSGDTEPAARPRDAVTGFLDRVVDYLVGHPYLPRLLQRAALDDSRYLRATLGRSLRPLYAQGISVIGRSAGGWDADELAHLGAGLYLLIFGYFANAQLIGIVAGIEPLTPSAIERQRHFLRTAVGQLLEAQPVQTKPERQRRTTTKR